MSPLTIFMSPGETETGLWCDRCNLPSKVRLEFFLTSEIGSSRGIATVCTDCEDSDDQ